MVRGCVDKEMKALSQWVDLPLKMWGDLVKNYRMW